MTLKNKQNTSRTRR